MSRLTQSIRETIKNRAIKAAFAEREQAMKDAESLLGIEAYESVFPQVIRDQAAAMPDGWLRQDSCLRFNASGWNVTLTLKEGVPVPSARYGCEVLASLTGDLAERVQARKTASEKLREQRYSAERELAGFLEQFKSFKSMREAWPEGKPFYESFDVEAPKGGVPAVRVAEINKLLNIAEAA